MLDGWAVKRYHQQVCSPDMTSSESFRVPKYQHVHNKYSSTMPALLAWRESSNFCNAYSMVT